MKNFLKKYGSDALIVAGCGLILVFVHRVWPVGTWLTGGIMCIGLGVMIGLGRDKA